MAAGSIKIQPGFEAKAEIILLVLKMRTEVCKE
jgi:hypothetical protein